MAKALFGHVGVGPDPRLAEEVGRLRRRVRDLENEVERLRDSNETLVASLRVPDDMINLRVPDTLPEPAEPALA
jgi:hypothetical protein